MDSFLMRKRCHRALHLRQEVIAAAVNFGSPSWQLCVVAFVADHAVKLES